MLLAVLLSQETPIDPGLLDRFGAWGVCLILTLGAITWLVRQLAAERAANRDLTERLITQAEKSIPLLERTAAALERREDRR